MSAWSQIALPPCLRAGRFRRALPILALSGGLLAGCGGGAEDLAARGDDHWRLLDAYCVDCHNSTEFTAGLAFDAMSPDEIAVEADIWEEVVRKLRGGLMPPPGGPRPEGEEVDGFVAWMEERLDAAHPEPDPGYAALHRLNRTEYANAIRDLLALNVDPAELLPVDGTEAGFNNVANALNVSPTFIDQYLGAARTLAARAVGEPAPRPAGVPYDIPSTGQEFRVEGLPLGTRGGAAIRHYFPSDGEYLLNIGDMVSGRFGINQEHVNTLIATIDGRKFFELDIGGGDDLKALDQRGQEAVDEINARLKNIPFTATAGEHTLGVTFLHRSFAESDRQLHSLVPGRGQDAVLTVNSVEIFGPVQPAGLSRTASRDAIFICHPEQPSEEPDCARRIISQLTGKAFRGLAVDEDIDRLMELYDLGYETGGFEEGVEYALSGVLAHPKFLYRIEEPPEDFAPGGAYALSSVELASRLSFFLWSTIPDEELLELAAADALDDPAVFEQQVMRMLAEPRSQTLASNFAYQWLGLSELDAIDPDPAIFADVPADLREDLVRETILFIDSVFRADGSVLDLLSADHTYLNENLARHYNINDIRGNRFRRVELADSNRWGLLGKGAPLMVSSYANRTSPVLRGAWVLETLLGTPPSEPPPDVEALPETVEGQTWSTVRERLEVHRENPSCNNCHGVMDPLGFALENFDAVGRWRDRDRQADGAPIDATGVLTDGTPLSGPVDLRNALLKRPEQFVQTLTEKLMTYAIGRSLTHKDMPTVRRIVRQSAADDYRFSSIVLAIAGSEQFRLRRLPETEGVVASVAADE